MAFRRVDRCRFILQTFIDGEKLAAADNVHERVAQAQKKLDELAKRPEQLEMTLRTKIKDKVSSATEGNLILHPLKIGLPSHR